MSSRWFLIIGGLIIYGLLIVTIVKLVNYWEMDSWRVAGIILLWSIAQGFLKVTDILLKDSRSNPADE